MEIATGASTGTMSATTESGRRRMPLRVDVVVPVLVALAAYGSVIAVRGPSLSTATFSYADAPEGVYLGSALLGSPARLPQHSEVVARLLEAGLLRVPASHLLIQLLGPLISAAAVVVTSVAVRRLGGAWLLTAAVGLALGPIALWSTLFPTAHSYTLACLGLLALTVIALSRGRLRPWHALAVGVICGTAVLSDQGFVVEGLAPLALVSVMCRLRGDTRVTRSGVTLFGAAVVSTAVGALLLTAGSVHTIFALTPGASSSNTLASSLNTIVHTFSAMCTGAWYGADAPAPLGLLPALAGAAIALCAPLALLVQLRRSPHDGSRTAYLLFWASSDLLILAAFLLFGYGGAPIEGHYLIPCLFSAIATFPLLVTPRWSTAAAAVAATFVIVQAVGVLTVPAAAFAGPNFNEDARVLAAIHAQGLTRGYADYWMSHPITWLSGETVHVYPVQQRQCDGGLRICPYEYSADAWYPASRVPTFLLVLTTGGSCVVTAPASLGPPVRTVAVDGAATLVIYDHDIARSFTHMRKELC